MKFSIQRGVACLAMALGLTGCAGYRLGTMLPPDIQSVAVPTFVNRTTEPLLESETTRATIREFQQDGSLRVAPESEADAILLVELVDFSLFPIRFDEDRTTQANEYRLTITASILMTRSDTGEVVVENPRVYGEVDLQVTGDLSSAKREGLPEAAEDLAHDIVERVVEVW
jgi:hypothetical protein